MTVPHPEILAPSVVAGVALLAMTFTPSDINTAIISITALITAIGIVTVNIITARAAAKQRAEQIAKLDQVNAKADVIEGHVNSAATKAAGIIASQEAQMVLLRETIATQKKTAELLAQALATRTEKTVKKK